MRTKRGTELPLGSLDQYVLCTILRQNPNSYGVSIREDIEKRTGRTISLGAIYGTLDRLEGEGWIEARKGEATPERGGKRKLYFTVTGLGQAILSRSFSDLSRMAQGSGSILKPVTTRVQS